jgi:hypothetical protein
MAGAGNARGPREDLRSRLDEPAPKNRIGEVQIVTPVPALTDLERQAEAVLERLDSLLPNVRGIASALGIPFANDHPGPTLGNAEGFLAQLEVLSTRQGLLLNQLEQEVANINATLREGKR